MNNDINRYIHTYIEYLLNRLYKIVPDNYKTFVETELIENNNFKSIQIGRNISDKYPNIDFSIFQTLENFRKLKEIYIKNGYGGNIPQFKQLTPKSIDTKRCIFECSANIKYR